MGPGCRNRNCYQPLCQCKGVSESPQCLCGITMKPKSSIPCLNFMDPTDEVDSRVPQKLQGKSTLMNNARFNGMAGRLKCAVSGVVTNGAEASREMYKCLKQQNARHERYTQLLKKYENKEARDIKQKEIQMLAMSRPKVKKSPRDVKENPFEIKKSALQYKPTERMLKLAQVNPNRITPKYQKKVHHSSLKETQEKRKIWKARLEKAKTEKKKKASPSRKTKSKSRKSKSKSPVNKNKNQRSPKNKSDSKSDKEQSKSEKEKSKLDKEKSKLEREKRKLEREKRLEVMYARLAQPRRTFKDPTPEKKPPKPYSEIMKRVNELLALTKPPEPRISMDEFFKPKPVPDDYKPSDRLLELAQPKPLHPEYLLDMAYEWKIKKSALKYVPTERIKRLAIPKVRKDPEPDFDPDAFKVKSAALRYKATERIKRLAKPKVYPTGE